MRWSRGRRLHLFLVSGQGEGLLGLVPLEWVKGVEFCEAFHKSLVRLFLERKLDEVDYLSCI